MNAYKFTRLDGSWSIILSPDEFAASELFQSDNNICESDISNIEKLSLNTRIPNVYTEKKSTIAEMAESITFFPRCILDSEDLQNK